LFINSRWIDENYDTFMKLSKDPLFEIGNHGTSHLPLSVNGKSAYGIEGTGSLMDVINEVVENEDKVEKLTGRRPKYFRSGTAYYDEIAIKVAEEMGVKVMGFDIIRDAGATYSKSQIKRVCSNVKPGSILIFHMNHPEKETAEGIMEVVPLLRSKGLDFVKLEDYDLFLK
jgi:peptidoglycan/xylan/chitin deacetylase (PgdA/CDA1 family)